MPLQSGDRIGPYEVLSLLGAGGMGAVYRARDTRLNRELALKVLPDAFADDPERLSRFKREAQVLASLNHPHIAQVYGVEEVPPALLMELVRGEDLAARIARGPVPVPEALDIARQIADALDAAHAQGIVHRDLKPANVKVRDDGTVKVLDFGLAKAAGASVSGVSSGHSATITSPPAMTALGFLIGTAAYMAPEQAQGKLVDRGADLWAFGVVLYEMLAGRQAFEGETVTDVLAAILRGEPDWKALPPELPPSVLRLLRRLLERDRRRRLADAGEARFQLEEALAGTPDPLAPSVRAAPQQVSRGVLVPWALTVMLLMVSGFLAYQLSRPTPPVTGRYSLETPPDTTLVLAQRPSIAISPDGSTIVFAATFRGVDRLYLRPAGAFEASVIPGTENGSNPVISPDGRWVAFFANGRLLKVPLTGGPVTTLAEAPDPRGLTWDLDDTIVYTPVSVGGVFRVSPDGGTPAPVTTLSGEAERTHRWPQQLADGTVIYTVGTFSSPDSYEDAQIEAVRPDGARREVLKGAAMARVIGERHLVFLRGGDLYAMAIDPDSLAVRGTPVPVLRGVGRDASTGAAHVAVSRTGTLAYVSSGLDPSAIRVYWLSESGRPEPLPLEPAAYTDPAVSPDGRHVAFSVIAGGARDIWLYNLQRQTFTRLSFSSAGEQNYTPMWSADGKRLYYVRVTADGTSSTIHRHAIDGSSPPDVVLSLPFRAYLGFIYPGERRASLDQVLDGPGVSNIVTVDLVTGAEPKPFIATDAEEFGARLSPDAKWVAYVSRESGRYEVYVRPAEGEGGRWQVSNGTGDEPHWSPDGRRLYYRSGTTLMRVDVERAATFLASAPRPVLGGLPMFRNDTSISYSIDPVTGRVLAVRPAEEGLAPSALRVVLNWEREVAQAIR